MAAKQDKNAQEAKRPELIAAFSTAFLCGVHLLLKPSSEAAATFTEAVGTALGLITHQKNFNKFLATSFISLLTGALLVLAIQQQINLQSTRDPNPDNVPAPEIYLQPIAFVTDDHLHIRSGPGTQYDSLGQLRKGTILYVISKDKYGMWVKVKGTDGHSGWVSLQYVELNINLMYVPLDCYCRR